MDPESSSRLMPMRNRARSAVALEAIRVDNVVGPLSFILRSPLVSRSLNHSLSFALGSCLSCNACNGGFQAKTRGTKRQRGLGVIEVQTTVFSFSLSFNGLNMKCRRGGGCGGAQTTVFFTLSFPG